MTADLSFARSRPGRFLACCMALMAVAESGCAPLPVQENRAAPYAAASVLYEKAFECYQRSHYRKAKDLWHAYIGTYPDSLVLKAALYYLAHCHQMLGEDKEAVALYDRIVTTYGDEDFWGQQAMLRRKQVREGR